MAGRPLTRLRNASERLDSLASRVSQAVAKGMGRVSPKTVSWMQGVWEETLREASNTRPNREVINLLREPGFANTRVADLPEFADDYATEGYGKIPWAYILKTKNLRVSPAQLEWLIAYGFAISLHDGDPDAVSAKTHAALGSYPGSSGWREELRSMDER